VKQLCHDAFNRARRFLKTQDRPLDHVLFEHRFEAAPAERVQDELARYQNADGGFGHALEPDVCTPSSSALATGIGLTLIKELECPPEHAMVTAAVRFLRQTFDEEVQVWRVISHDANNYPHAPWWHDEDGSLARTFDDFLIIPRAQIVGLRHDYAALVPADWFDAITEATVTAIETLVRRCSARGACTSPGGDWAPIGISSRFWAFPRRRKRQPRPRRRWSGG